MLVLKVLPEQAGQADSVSDDSDTRSERELWQSL